MTDRNTVRVGVFDDPERARRAIENARLAGFDQIHLICEDKAIRRGLMDRIERDHGLVLRSPSAITARSAPIGAVIGFLIGLTGMIFAASTLGIGGIGNLFVIATGAVFGAFVGAMLSRAFTSEVQDFYDQELAPDEILVAIEVDERRMPGGLERAEEILTRAGVEPVTLSEG